MALADYLRDDPEVALVAPFGDAMSEADWAAEYQPYEDLMLAHQPMAAWARYNTPAPLAIGAPLGSGAELHAATPATLDSPDLARIERAAASTTHTVRSCRFAALPLLSIIRIPKVLPLYAMRPRLDRAATDELETALAALKHSGEIDGYVWTHSLPMRHLAEQVEVLLLLPVGTTVDKAMFPQYKD